MQNSFWLKTLSRYTKKTTNSVKTQEYMKNKRKRFVGAIKNAVQSENTILLRSASIDHNWDLSMTERVNENRLV